MKLAKYFLAGIFGSAFAYVAITHASDTALLANALGGTLNGFTRTLYGK